MAVHQRLFRADRVRRALDEGLDLIHVALGQLAGEVRHALVPERAPEHEILSRLCDRRLVHVAEVGDIAAAVHARYAVAEDAVADVERVPFRTSFGSYLTPVQQVRPCWYFDELRHLGLAADREGVDRARRLRARWRARDPVHAAPAHGDRHVLLAVDLVGDRRGHHAGAGGLSHNFLPVLRVVGDEAAVRRALEHQVARGGQRAAIPRRHMFSAPGLLLRHRVPGDQPAERLALGRHRVERNSPRSSRLLCRA